jgi:hypothetical protein
VECDVCDVVDVRKYLCLHGRTLNHHSYPLSKNFKCHKIFVSVCKSAWKNERTSERIFINFCAVKLEHAVA